MKQNSYFGSDEKLAFGYFQRTILFSNVSKFKIAICFGGLLGFILLIWLFTVALRSKPTESPTSQIHVKKSDLGEAFIDSSIIFASCDYKNEELRQMIESVKKTLDFIEKNVNGIAVLDAVFGTRVLESQLRLFQLGHSKLPKSFQDALQFIQYWCKRLSETIIQRMVSLEMSIAEREHMLRNLYWVNDTTLYESPGIGNWRSDSEPKMVLLGNVTIKSMLSKGNLMSEETWDNCIADVFQDCTVTDDCDKLFIEEIGSLYPLTHQIFYHHFAKKKNCLNNKHFIKKMGGRSSEVLVHQMCNKVWQEAHAIEEADFPSMLMDLLMEQVTVCSLLGYTQFLKVSWLKRLFSSQGETGCFILYSKETAQKQRSTQTNILDRVKRSDNQIDTGSEECSVHFTSVALSAMGMHLRYLGDTCLRNY